MSKDSGLRGPDKTQGDLVDQRDDPTREIHDGLRRRNGPINKDTGRGNDVPPAHVPQAEPRR